AGRLRRAPQRRRARAVPGFDAAFDCDGQHAAKLGEDRLRRHQSGRRHQGERSWNGSGSGNCHGCRFIPRTALARPREEMKRLYTDEHAQAGIDAPLPEIETWTNQFPGYEIEIVIPEFTSV